MNHILNRLSAKPRASTAADQPPTAKAAVLPKEKLKLRGVVGKAAITIISTAVTFSILLGADLYLHHKHEINLWGYRGPAVGQKQPGEKRIVVLGGSTAWGYGLAVAQSFPGQLQQRFAERFGSEGGPPINVLNLAYNAEGAYSFKYTLRDYDYLDYDVVLIYSGYNDLWEQNLFVNRHRSPIFIWTGYLPLLPSLTADKIEIWRNRRRKENKPIVIAPPGEDDPDTRQRLDQLIGSGPSDANSSQGNYAKWQFYCEQIYAATDLALKRGKRVLIVTEPYLNDNQVEQQRTLEDMLTKRFTGQASLRYLNLGRTVDVRDRSLSWDGMHLTEEGNRRIAEALTQPVLEMLQR
jgi:lysophospholipase L1-like esterase